MMNADRELDVRGLNCPLPILRAKKVLGDLSAGQVLKVMATDPGSVKDFQAFCKQTGNELLSHSPGPRVHLLHEEALSASSALRNAGSWAAKASPAKSAIAPMAMKVSCTPT
jgi:tRNA 2-thiouridine synthesizing protein A